MNGKVKMLPLIVNGLSGENGPTGRNDIARESGPIG